MEEYNLFGDKLGTAVAKVLCVAMRGAVLRCFHLYGLRKWVYAREGVYCVRPCWIHLAGGFFLGEANVWGGVGNGSWWCC